MTDRENVLVVFAPRVLAGAIEDAGGLYGDATPHDYELAIETFICARRRHAPSDLAG